MFTLRLAVHLVLLATQWAMLCFYPHGTNEEAGTQRGWGVCAESHKHVSYSARTLNQSCAPLKSDPYSPAIPPMPDAVLGTWLASSVAPSPQTHCSDPSCPAPTSILLLYTRISSTEVSSPHVSREERSYREEYTGP